MMPAVLSPISGDFSGILTNMYRLCYETLEKTGYDGYILRDAPVRILQFGEGNFLRAFFDQFVDILNEKAGFDSKVLVCQPRGGKRADTINDQEGLYTLILRGLCGGRREEHTRVISCISKCLNPVRDFDLLMEAAADKNIRFIVSNTTEAGIAFDDTCRLDDRPASSFPGKLTQFLYERYRLGLPGFIILPCELIDRNGDVLCDLVGRYAGLWDLPADFSEWLRNENTFCSTLVDRIVTGYPKDEAEKLCEDFGYEDELTDTGELFASWVIEADKDILREFPADKADLPIIITDNVDPYKKRKVRMLNGAHTSSVMAAYLAGLDTVGDCMDDEIIRGFMKRTLYDEIIPVLNEFDKKELEEFADAVAERFSNPFIHHELLSIALNSTAKWKARVMPTVIEYHEMTSRLPKHLTFSFAAYLSFYHRGKQLTDEGLIGLRGQDSYCIKDDRYVLEEFYALRESPLDMLAKTVIGNERMWGGELKKLPGFTETVIRYLELIETEGIYEAIKHIEHDQDQSER